MAALLSPPAPSFQTHEFRSRFLCLSQITGSWDPVLSCTGDTQHSALLSPPYSVQRNWMETIYLSSAIERLKKKFIQTFSFDSPPPRMSPFASESCFPTHYTTQFERISRLFNMLLFLFLAYKFTRTFRDLISLPGTGILFLVRHSFQENHAKGEQTHLEIWPSETQSLNPACSPMSQAYSCSELSGPAHSELQSHGNV